MLTVLLMLQFAGPLDVEGVWRTANGRAHVEIVETEDSIRGQIIWYANYTEDLENGTVNDSVLGKTLLENFVRGDGQWHKGTIHDLRKGQSYRSVLIRDDDETLMVKGCRFFVCRGQEWTRVPPSEVVRLTNPSGPLPTGDAPN